jgi:hypothetical protein
MLLWNDFYHNLCQASTVIEDFTECVRNLICTYFKITKTKGWARRYYMYVSEPLYNYMQVNWASIAKG